MSSESHDPVVRSIDDPSGEELRTFYRIDSTAFGETLDEPHVVAKRPLVDPGRFLIASVDGVDAGAAGTFPFDLTLPGGAAVPVAGIADVGVLPTHRRRGVMRALVDRMLDDSAARGEAAAVLNASEAAIYGRFGFGIATRWRRLHVDTRTARLRDPHRTGEVRIVTKEEAARLLPTAYERTGAGRPGWLSRSQRWWDAVLGDTRMYLGGGDGTFLVHLDADGEPDGFAIYGVDLDWSSGTGEGRLDVSDLVATDPGARLDLWRVLLEHDLVHKVVAGVPVDDPILDALVDPRSLQTVYEGDQLWIRPLDVERLLSSRRYRAEGEVVFDVRDPTRPRTTGRYRLAARATGAECARDDDAPPDLTLDVAELGSLVLGGGSARRLARVGRIQEDVPGAAEVVDALFGVDPLPWCPTRF